MPRLSLCFVLTLSALLLSACGLDETTTSPPSGPANVQTESIYAHRIAGEIIQASGWAYDLEEKLEVMLDEQDVEHGSGALCGYEREPLLGDIAHYWWEIPIGPGEYDKIRLHRVVKESEPHQPIRTRRTLFGVHGTPGNFEAMYLVGSVVASAPEDLSLAVYLAQNDVDVWGIDQAYTLLPVGVVDFSFMENWGLQFDAENVLEGMSIARLVRRFTGNGNDKMILMGYSTGFATGFAALNIETQLPPGLRQVGGYIPVDYYYKTQDPVWRESECAYAADVEGLLQAGVYQNDFGLLFQTLGSLAENDPSGDSPIIPGTTNLQAALLAGALTGLVFGFPGDVHFLAGIFDPDGNPVDLRYTPLPSYLEWLQQFNNYGSNFLEYDIAALHCDEVDSPHDDHLQEITVPVFFVGARGGFGPVMDYTASLIGSDDITLINIQLDPEVLLDIGHVDLYTAEVAREVFWEPVLGWIVDHSRGGPHGSKTPHSSR